ncbi:uncharacterized protein LOC121729489 [Aricia agestis]|uniref:uncharacterized protein LOC121729489 n=1 Tax=Aricia agestis TaxID=91739 RepID=UPI001C20C30C|nr:uncharacterized protein LOC121729489 [Aricia agestis]
MMLPVAAYSSCTADFVKICKRDQDTVNECVRNSIEELRPHLLRGIPEIRVPSIDPYVVDELRPVQGNLNVLFKNVRVTGAGDFQMKRLDVDIESRRVNTTITVPALHFEGYYSVDAHVLSVPIKGSGNFAANLTECEATVILKYEVEDRNGKVYAKYVSCDLLLRVGDYHITMEGITGIGDLAERMINENKREMLHFVLPYIQGTVGQAIVLEAANRISSTATYDEFFPEP